jgi:hypothetical protein
VKEEEEEKEEEKEKDEEEGGGEEEEEEKKKKWFDFWYKQETSPFMKESGAPSRSAQLPIQWVPGCFPGGKEARP